MKRLDLLRICVYMLLYCRLEMRLNADLRAHDELVPPGLMQHVAPSLA